MQLLCLRVCFVLIEPGSNGRVQSPVWPDYALNSLNGISWLQLRQRLRKSAATPGCKQKLAALSKPFIGHAFQRFLHLGRMRRPVENYIPQSQSWQRQRELVVPIVPDLFAVSGGFELKDVLGL